MALPPVFTYRQSVAEVCRTTEGCSYCTALARGSEKGKGNHWSNSHINVVYSSAGFQGKIQTCLYSSSFKLHGGESESEQIAEAFPRLSRWQFLNSFVTVGTQSSELGYAHMGWNSSSG